jgi:class 3 adenylate cyclase
MLDERQDYFGQTVNVAARVQGLADPSAILVTRPIVESPEVARLLAEAGLDANERSSTLRGVSEPVSVYELRSALGESRGDDSKLRRLYA